MQGRRSRTRGVAIALVAMVVGVGLLGACSGDDAADPVPSKQPATAPTDPAPADPSAPSMAAAARSARLRDVPDGSTDCGTVAADSGWPTTTIAVPGTAGACLVSALSAHRPAVMVFTGRTGDGGALVTRYQLSDTGSLGVTVHSIASTGEETQTTSTCAPPAGPWSIGVEGRVVVTGLDPAYC